MTHAKKPYIELHYSSPQKVLTGATLVSGDLRIDLPHLTGADVESSAIDPCRTTLRFFGLHSVEVWDD